MQTLSTIVIEINEIKINEIEKMSLRKMPTLMNTLMLWGSRYMTRAYIRIQAVLVRLYLMRASIRGRWHVFRG